MDQKLQLQMPQIELTNIGMTVVDAKNEAGEDIKVLVMGPLVLTLPLDDGGVEWLKSEIEAEPGKVKVDIVPAGVLAQLPTHPPKA